MTPTLEAMLDYARRGWPVFPMSPRKVPLTHHGLLDATTDIDVIQRWARRWPELVPALATGKPSGIVALDVDIRPGVSGIDSLQALGINFHPITPTAHTPSGGYHLLFAAPGHFVKTIAGKLGPGLDIRADGGGIMVPPATRRFWDPHLGPETPLATMPSWMVVAEFEPPLARAVPAGPTGELSPHCEHILDNAYQHIVEAPNGQQEITLNREAFRLAILVNAAGMPAGLVLEVLHLAASKMPSYDPKRPWGQKELTRKITDAFTAGLRRARVGYHG